MTNMIQMPDVAELKEELAAAKSDLHSAIKDEPELASQSRFLMEVLDVLEARIASEKDLNKLDRKEQISIIAHLNLFYSLLDDVFGDEFEDDEDLDFDDVDEDEE